MQSQQKPQQPHRPVPNCSEGAKPLRSQVGSVIGCKLPLEGETLGKIVSFSQDNSQRGLSAEGDLLEDGTAGGMSPSFPKGVLIVQHNTHQHPPT